MKIAFLNLILNALEAMESNHGVLQLKTEKQDRKCIIRISDNGIGMDEDTLERIFDPYFTQKKGGNGLGLTNVQNIILNHKGTIEAKSIQGFDTTFIVTLDLAEESD